MKAWIVLKLLYWISLPFVALYVGMEDFVEKWRRRKVKANARN